MTTPLGVTQTRGWSAVLGNIRIDGGNLTALGSPAASGYCELPPVVGCLSEPPDGLGLPELRTQDVDYLGRDGVRHHQDFYEPRIITLKAVIGPDGCGCLSKRDVRAKVRDLLAEWRRVCSGERELVIFPPQCNCEGSTPDDLDRPLGIVGRGRQAPVVYDRTGAATVTLRFDATDHLMRLLDCCGTPGSGEQCITLTPTLLSGCRTYDRCYEEVCSPGVSGYTYPLDPGAPGGPVTFTAGGTECVVPSLTLNGPLTQPRIEHVDTGEVVFYDGSIATDDAVVINLGDGTATTDDGADRTYLLSGDYAMRVDAGENTWRLTAVSGDGTGELCFHPSVVSA